MFRLLSILVCAFSFSCLAAEQRALKVHVVTWNVNSQPPPEDLDHLLGQKEAKPDVIIVGLQEVTMKPTQALLDFLFNDKWSLKLASALKNDYSKVKTKVSVSLGLTVFVKTELSSELREIEGSIVNTGFGGIYGNKGATLINFRLLGHRFGVINSHLPANDGAVEARIRDIETIESHREKETFQPQDYIFWLGDLNFRVADTSLDAETIEAMVNKGFSKEVLEKDELIQLMQEGRVFKGWTEPEINFKPTFKVKIGDGSYNLKRRPAWTDRVLYKSDTGKQIENKLYDSVDGYLESDHKPVVSQFEITID